MSQATLTVSIISRDSTLFQQLQKSCPEATLDYSPALPDKSPLPADIIIADAALLPDREHCKPGSILVGMAEPAGARTESMDELWPLPLPEGYALQRLARLIVQVQAREKAARDALFLDAVIDTSPDLIWFKDLQGRHLKVNQAFCEAVGKTKAQVEGRGHYYIWDIPPEEYAAGEYVCLETEEIVLAKRKRCLFDEKVKCRQGMRQFKPYKAPLMDASGAMLGTVGVAQDVTRLHKTTSLLSQNKAEFDTTIDITNLHFWKLNISTRTAYLGALYATETGLPHIIHDYPESLIASGFVDEESVVACREAMEALRRGKKEVAYDLKISVANSGEHWRRVKYSNPERNESNDIVYIGISQNIDEYKRMERYFSISTLQAGVFTWIYEVGEGCITSLTNSRFFSTIGSKSLNNVPEVFRTFAKIHPQDRAAMVRLHETICRGKPFASIECRWRDLDSENWRWMRIAYTSIYTPTQKVERAIGTARDITEQKKAEKAYLTQVAYRESILHNALQTVLVNLSRNVVCESHGIFGDAIKDQPADAAWTVLQQGMLAVTAPDCPANMKSLVTAFKQGKANLSFEHQYLDPQTKYQRWGKTSISLISNPETGEIEAFLTLEDIDKQKIVESCYNAVAHHDYDSLSYIDARSGKMCIFHHKDSTRLGDIPYSEYTASICQKLADRSDIPAYSLAMRLEHILEQLEHSLQHTVFFRLMKDDVQRHKRAQFSFIDRTRGLLCLVISDITDAVKEEQRRNRKLENALEDARQANQAKTAFLANMSHEIRTPMNTIIGICEIMLRSTLPSEQASNVITIQNAGVGLLGIINDILDYSKVESGKFELNSVGYALKSLLTDVVTMFNVPLAAKPLRFVLTVSPDVPSRLVGDELRIRQILTNLLSNAVKYTKQGFIWLDVSCRRDAYKGCTLILRVEDSGCGIRPQDLPNLFQRFSRVDTVRNRGIVGTGLGLALCHRFTKLMGGSLDVRSEYDKGSVFTARMPQGIDDSRPMARLNGGTRQVLVFEDDHVLVKALEHTLAALGTPHAVCATAEDFSRAAAQATHAILRRSRMEAVRPSLYGLKGVALLLENDEMPTTLEPNWQQFSPAQFGLHAAAFLNNDRTDSPMQHQAFDRSLIRPLPGARILVVDDNETNLRVAVGLMAPYKMSIDTASSGEAALELVRLNRYDLIFMDHMMPEMDGVETLKRLRALPVEGLRTIPVIALTANAIAGAKENFLQLGFTGFLAKPINVADLHALLMQHVHPDTENSVQATPQQPDAVQEEEVPQAPSGQTADAGENGIPGIDISAMQEVYGDPEIYFDILRTYGDDIGKLGQELRNFFDQNDLSALTISAHAVKGASRGVGATALGDLAERVEETAKQADEPGVRQAFPPFIEALEAMAEQVQTYLERRGSAPEAPAAAPTTTQESFAPEDVESLQKACAGMEYEQAEAILDRMARSAYVGSCADTLKAMKEACDNFDYPHLDELAASLTGK